MNLPMTTRDPIPYTFYRAATACAAPLVAAWLRTSRHRPMLERFRPKIPNLEAQPVWLHACSVGEIGAAKPMVYALHDRWPHVPVVLTVSTESGLNLANTLAAPWLHITRLPFDTTRAVRRFLDALNPRGLLLMETELWPSLVFESRRRDIPVMLVSGRVSAKHYQRYRRAAWFFRPLLERLSVAAVQTSLYAERFAALGVPPDRIHITGNAKYDGAIMAVEGIETTRAAIDLEPGEPVVVFGSTRPGDEALAIACWRIIREHLPNLRLIIAPRHLQRLDEALRAIGEPVDRWSQIAQGGRCRRRILVVDTMGELIRFYALSTVAVVGGSFHPGVEGHNPFEPAALGVPAVFGPYMANFAEPASMLIETGGALQVNGPDELPAALADLLSDPARRDEIGANARGVVMQSRGAIARTLDLIHAHLVL